MLTIIGIINNVSITILEIRKNKLRSLKKEVYNPFFKENFVFMVKKTYFNKKQSREKHILEQSYTYFILLYTYPDPICVDSICCLMVLKKNN